jgi:hypothetical protein
MRDIWFENLEPKSGRGVVEPGNQQGVITQGFQERGSAMMVRVLGVLALILLQTEAVRAEERGGLLHRVSCTVVRYYVAKYTAPAAEAWARSKGASDAEIETARRCLGGAGQAVQAASLSAH